MLLVFVIWGVVILFQKFSKHNQVEKEENIYVIQQTLEAMNIEIMPSTLNAKQDVLIKLSDAFYRLAKMPQKYLDKQYGIWYIKIASIFERLANFPCWLEPHRMHFLNYLDIIGKKMPTEQLYSSYHQIESLYNPLLLNLAIPSEYYVKLQTYIDQLRQFNGQKEQAALLIPPSWLLLWSEQIKNHQSIIYHISC